MDLEDAEYPTFEKLDRLRLLLTEIKDRQAISLQQYYDAESGGFYHLYDSPNPGKYSKSSTATCILSLVATGQWQSNSWCTKTLELAKTMLMDKWASASLLENNAFTVAFILEAITALLETIPDEEMKRFAREAAHKRRFTKAEQILRDAIIEGFVQIEPYPPSAYLTQLVVRVLKRRSALPKGLEKTVEDWASRELDRQLALLIAQSKTADLFQLAYCAILVASLGDPGRITPDQSLILQAALDQLFERQLEDGSWPRSRPLFHYPEIGNAYCYEYEMLVQLVSQPTLEEKLRRRLPELAKSAYALRDIGFQLSDGGLGWSSGHHSQIAGPESWSTASVYHFAHVLDRLVAEAMRRSVFLYLDQPYLPPRRQAEEFAAGFLDCPLSISHPPVSLREVLLDHFVDLVAKEKSLVERGLSMPAGTPMSAIFFGPPGTSKTELTRHIANFLGWPMLTIDPSHFVRNGMDQIQAEADRIFSMLSKMERVVVLLDEFDEMVRDRQEASEVLSRFLTTAMLPKLVSISKNRRIVFIVATNYIDHFDSAIRRPGRFDLLLQVMPPTAEEKLRHWYVVDEHLRSLGVRLDEDNQRMEQIAELTFDEFREIVRRLETANNATEALQTIDQAYQRCTLQSKWNDTKTWVVACTEQQDRIRVPSIPE